MKKLEWVGDSLDRLKLFPSEVSRFIGFALHQVQEGEKPHNAKPLKGLGGVYEIIQPFETDTYRAVYIAKLKNSVYVLHCFQKKSKKGKSTPQTEINLIEQRLKVAKAHDSEKEGKS